MLDSKIIEGDKEFANNSLLIIDPVLFAQKDFLAVLEFRILPLLEQNKSTIQLPAQAKEIITKVSPLVDLSNRARLERIAASSKLLKQKKVLKVKKVPEGFQFNSYTELLLKLIAGLAKKGKIHFLSGSKPLLDEVVSIGKKLPAQFQDNLTIFSFKSENPPIIQQYPKFVNFGLKKEMLLDAITFTGSNTYAVPFKANVSLKNYDTTPLHCSQYPSVKSKLISNKYGNIVLTAQLAQGGEGIVYTASNGMLAKIYKKDKFTQSRFEKLKPLIANNESKKEIAWPKDLLKNSVGEYVGFLMEKAEGTPISELIFMPPVLIKNNWDRTQIVEYAISLASIVQHLHNINVLIGDINGNNFLSEGTKASIIDVDSFQVEGHVCPVGYEDFIPARLQGKDFKSVLRTKEDEQFSFAILLFMVLFCGRHPFSNTTTNGPGVNIKNKNFTLLPDGSATSSVPPGHMKILWSQLPLGLRQSFYDVFMGIKTTTVDSWIPLLKEYLDMIKIGVAQNEILPSVSITIQKTGTKKQRNAKNRKKIKKNAQTVQNSTNTVNTKTQSQSAKIKTPKTVQKQNAQKNTNTTNTKLSEIDQLLNELIRMRNNPKYQQDYSMMRSIDNTIKLIQKSRSMGLPTGFFKNAIDLFKIL